MTFAKEFFESNFPIIGGDRAKTAIEGLNLKIHSQLQAMPTARRVKSNTTVFAIRYNDGVVIAGDRRMSGGWYDIVSDNTIKVQEISKFSAIACAGYCNVISFLEENMLALCSNFSRRYHQELSPDGQATFLRYLLEGWWFISLFYWYWNVGLPVLVAYDVQLEQPRIFSFSEDGFYFEPEYAAGTGCGWDAVKNVIADYWYDSIKADFAIDIAVRAMIHSGATSHGVSDSRLVLPKVALIDRRGFRWVPEKTLAQKRDEIVSQIGGLNA